MTSTFAIPKEPANDRHFQVNGYGAGMTPIMGVEQFARSFDAAFEQARSDEDEALADDGWREHSGPCWSDCSRVVVYDLTGDTFESELEDNPGVAFTNMGGNEWRREGDAS